jgi:hypothetical protein
MGTTKLKKSQKKHTICYQEIGSRLDLIIEQIKSISEKKTKKVLEKIL